MASATTAASAPAATNTKPELGLLEEDDEFEEFPVEEWREDKEDQSDLHQWEDNWDDDNVEDDFSKQLRYMRGASIKFKMSGAEYIY